MIVLAWVLLAGAGSIVSGWNTFDAYLDLRALGSLSNGRRIIAVGWARREAIRCGVQFLWLLLGLSALGRDVALAPGIVVLLATNLALLVSTILDARDRLRLRRIIG